MLKCYFQWLVPWPNAIKINSKLELFVIYKCLSFFKNCGATREIREAFYFFFKRFVCYILSELKTDKILKADKIEVFDFHVYIIMYKGT